MYDDELASKEELISTLADDIQYLEYRNDELQNENSELLKMFRELYGLLLPDYNGPPPVDVALEEMKERIEELQGRIKSEVD